MSTDEALLTIKLDVLGIVFINVGVVDHFGLLLVNSNYAVGIFDFLANRNSLADVDEALTVVNICSADALDIPVGKGSVVGMKERNTHRTKHNRTKTI